MSVIKQMSPGFNHGCKINLSLGNISWGWIYPVSPLSKLHSNYRCLCRIEKAFSLWFYVSFFNGILVHSEKYPCLQLQVTRSELNIICIDWHLICRKKAPNMNLMSVRKIRLTYPERLESSATLCGRGRFNRHSANCQMPQHDVRRERWLAHHVWLGKARDSCLWLW